MDSSDSSTVRLIPLALPFVRGAASSISFGSQAYPFCEFNLPFDDSAGSATAGCFPATLDRLVGFVTAGTGAGAGAGVGSGSLLEGVGVATGCLGSGRCCC